MPFYLLAYEVKNHDLQIIAILPNAFFDPSQEAFLHMCQWILNNLLLFSLNFSLRLVQWTVFFQCKLFSSNNPKGRKCTCWTQGTEEVTAHLQTLGLSDLETLLVKCSFNYEHYRQQSHFVGNIHCFPVTITAAVPKKIIHHIDVICRNHCYRNAFRELRPNNTKLEHCVLHCQFLRMKRLLVELPELV